MYLPIIFALITFAAWGSGDVFSAVGSRKIGAYSAAFWIAVFAAVFSLFYLPFAPALVIETKMLLIIVGLGAVQALAWYLFNKGLEIGNATLVGAIAATYSSIVVVLSILFLGENISLNQGVAIIVALVGVALMSIDFESIKNGIKMDRGILYAILTMLLWGFYFTFIKIPVQAIGWYWPGFIVVIVMSVLYFFYLHSKKIPIKNPFIKGREPVVPLAALFSIVGALSLNAAFEIGQSSIVAPISGSYPILYVLLSYLVFREKITKQQIFGILLTLVGIVALVFSI